MFSLSDFFPLSFFLFIEKFIPKKTLSLKLNGILKIISLNPFFSFLSLLILYPLLSLLLFPFYLLSFLFTSFGSFLFFLFLCLLLIRYFTRSIIFPGSLPSLQRNISKDYLKGMSTQFERIGNSISNFSSSVVHFASGIGSNLSFKLNEFEELVTKSIPILLIVLKEGLQEIEKQVERI